MSMMARSTDMPCDLCTETPHARIRGICDLCAMILPPIDIEKLCMDTGRSFPSTNRTTGRFEVLMQIKTYLALIEVEVSVCTHIT